ncbi:FGGY-family carbohydrate kinase [Enterococcus mundtii]|nr:FGGY-family carbohydrate kinase [Enterococcus mundtii]
MGVTLAAGDSLSWFKQRFAPNRSFSELLSEIGSVDAGSNGLLFTPYIVGERTPYSDSQIRGSFIGIDTQHELKHFTRSVLEGITFSLKDSQAIMEEMTQQKSKQSYQSVAAQKSDVAPNASGHFQSTDRYFNHRTRTWAWRRYVSSSRL